MRKKSLGLIILSSLICATIYAQKDYIIKESYVIKRNEDTVKCYIKKIDINKIKLIDNNVLTADSIKSFLFEDTKWTSYAIAVYDDKKKDIKYENVFLPQPTHKEDKFELGNWGKALGTKHEYSILCKTDGKTILYEIDGNFNSGTFSTQINLFGGGEMSTESTIYIKNDLLGVTKMRYAKKHSLEANQEIIEVLKKYTEDKPEIVKKLDSSFWAKYKNVKRYLEEYISTKQ